MLLNKIEKKKRNWFISILKQDIKILIGTLIIGVLVSFLGLAVSIFSQKLIDDIIPSNDIRLLIIGLSIAAGLLFLKIFLNYSQQYLGITHSKRFNLSLINKFFNLVLYLPKSFFDKNKTGGLISRMNDSASIQQTVSYIANTLVLNVLVLIVSCSVLFHYSVTVGIISLSSFPIFLTIALVFKEKIADKTRIMMEANARKESSYISTIQNIDLLKTHNKQEIFSKINYDTYGTFQEKSFTLGKTGLGLGTLSESIGTIVYIIMLSYVSFQVTMGNMTIGEFTATLGIATGMLYPIGTLGMCILHLQGAKVAFERMYEFISVKPEFDTKDDIKKPGIESITKVEFKDVFFSYDPNIKLLKSINFTINKGEVVSFFGKNGSGKSTILNLIMALYEKHSGNILFNGIDISELSITKLREKIAIVSQQSKLFDSTVIQNICFDSDEELITNSISKLNKLGFGEFINSLSHGYHTQILENGKNLSGGQKQIISLARALIKKPDILILDEPTAALDGSAENFILSKIKEYAKHGMVIMVTHKLKPARESDKILVLENGTIKNSGSHSELLLFDNFYSQRFAEYVY